MKTLKTAPIVSRSSYTEKLVFTSKPDHATRRQLSAAGWKWNGVVWWRNQSQTVLITPKELASLITPAQQPELATA